MKDAIVLGHEQDPAKRLRQQWGRSIRRYRELRGFTLVEVAEAMGGIVSPQAIGMWERGETAPRWHHQHAFCKVIDAPHSEVFRPLEDAA